MKKIVIFLATSIVFIISSAAAFAQDQAAAESPVPETQEQKPVESDAVSEISAGTVARGVFTSGVQNHEPVDQLSEADTDTKTVSFFTELKDFQGQTVIHRWEYNGQQMAEVKFQVGGPRWRVWSSKNMVPEWVGTWTVSVISGSGEVVDSKTLNYTAAPVEAAAATPAATSTSTVADSTAVEADAAPSETAQ